MQLVLLSGGSGLRLWPLSNNTRSKQFLPLLKADDGSMESMLQRVVRQVRETNLASSVTIATSKTQRDMIINQLGNGVDVVAEPERRDTFPAIALAVSYLSLQKGCPDDEVVVIMPCDPYTENDFFHSIGNMVNAVEQNKADLVLMGIKPTYPASKYGYIVPEEGNNDAVRMVSCFVEKPDRARAEELLARGAMWNSGVFAFRLGYVRSIVSKYITASSYEEVVAQYGAFPKISFDYEVVEKALSIAVVPFGGKWKDLGTWNTLSEEIAEDYIGNVTCGDNNSNSIVVNELGLPIFCDGLNNMVVACSPDGILVCGKDYSEGIKDKVSKLADRPMYEERRWGSYKVMGTKRYGDGYKSLTKELILRPGCSISYQRHKLRDEVWTFVDGDGVLALDGEIVKVKRGDVVHIKSGQMHAVKAVSQLQIIEVQMGTLLEEDDIERFPWDWE